MNGATSKVSTYAWAVVALLWPVALLNYLDRQMVATIRASIRADIPSIANDQEFGTLMAVFMWVYAFLSPLGGFVADKFNRRWTVIGSLGVWSAVTWATGQATTYSQMLCFRGLMGISEAFYIPAALALIADFHTGHTRARAVGVHQSGIYAGLALGGLGGYIAQTSTWRNCFTWFGAVGVIYSIVLMLALRDAPVTADEVSAKKNSVTVGETLRALWLQPAFWILVIYFTLPAIAGWVTKNWLPTYLADTFHLKEGPAGLSATGYIQMASFAGVLLGGVAADWWMRATPRGRIYASAVGVFLMVPALLGMGWAWSVGAAMVFMVLFGIGWGFFDCNNMPILCQIVRPELRATGYGFMNFVSISVGAGATVLLGWMRDHGIKFSVAFAGSATVALLSAGLILLIRPRREAELARR
ncbi:MAG TPA: MFS transporter [Verrucomicrobiae bacterium]|nr:MFS transporter [Verrucomicrobiae bacterium]